MQNVNFSSPYYARCLAGLRQSLHFARLSDHTQREIIALFQYQTIAKHASPIFDEPGRWFYLVVSGRAKVGLHHPESGREHIISVLGPGDAYDIVALVSGRPQDFIVTALDDMEVLIAPLAKAREWILAHPEFNRTLLPLLGEEMRRLADHIEDLALHDTETRLARLILRHLTSSSAVHGIRLINDLSQEALASMIGSVRVVVAQHVQSWKRQGILTGGRGKWSVADLPGLLEKAERRLHHRAEKS